MADACCGLTTNSWHHWAIKRCVSPWQAIAWAEDGSIESMRHHTLPWLGVMWHPERPNGAEDWVCDQLSCLASNR